MSVIVKGMEMPSCCQSCDFSDDEARFCKAAKEYIPMLAQPRFCPLVELPEKHGRLIDGDELADGCDAPHWCRWLSEIEDMPTIVEAEG